jgi:hypothetical protein
MLQAFDGKVNLPKTPLKLNEHSGKESNMLFAFSEQNWGAATRQLMERVKKRTVAQITSIINDACKTLLPVSKCKAPVSSTVTKVNQYGDICQSYHSAVHCKHHCSLF